METPRLVGGESERLIALTTSYGLYALKVTHYDSYDEDSIPHWSTACSSGFKVERAEVIWWAYADEVIELIEAFSSVAHPVIGINAGVPIAGIE
uniref:hypothetical protein n=1 Tax=Pseudomonas fluorescens TaxID=294 RepID=UPI00186797E5|nr:hypothetical protein [Pseudomonas fluorescens]